jgi:hypothetical protein
MEYIQDIEMKHRQILWTTVRIKAEKAWGSGTVIYSGQDSKGEWHNICVTCEHVVHDNIHVETKFDPRVGYDIKKETRLPCEVEFFYYDKYSICQGVSGSVKADIVAYNVDEDIALLELRRNAKVDYVAKMFPKDHYSEIHVFDPVYAVGAALGHEPVATSGIINFMNELIDEGVEYWMSNAPIIFGNCLIGDTLILTDKGLIPIKNIEKGTRVLALNNNGQYVFDEVMEKINSGIKEVYVLKTNRNKITASDNHPFYTINGWKMLKELNKGDKIRALSNIGLAQDTGLTVNDGRMIGIFLGDGTIRKTLHGGYETAFALFEPKDKDIIKFVKEYFNVTPSIVQNRGIAFYRKECYDKMLKLGLNETTCYTKRLPINIFYEKPEVKMAVLQGLMETDGNIDKRGEWRIELANKLLIEDIKTLAQTLGLDTNGPFYRERLTNMSNNKKCKTWKINIYPWDIKLVQYDTIKSITKIGKQETYDIKLKTYHNFIANGLVVHNSGGAIFRYSMERKQYEFLGMPARVAVSMVGFMPDPIPHLAWFVPINRIYKLIDDNFYQFIYDDKWTFERCSEEREKYRKEREKLLLAKFGGEPEKQKKYQ